MGSEVVAPNATTSEAIFDGCNAIEQPLRNQQRCRSESAWYYSAAKVAITCITRHRGNHVIRAYDSKLTNIAVRDAESVLILPRPHVREQLHVHPTRTQRLLEGSRLIGRHPCQAVEHGFE